MSDYQDQIVWITGASSGIGEALAIAFSQAGARLILSSRNRAELERVSQACAGDCLVLPMDVCDEAAMPGLIEQASQWQGKIDFLINNAGISQRASCLETQMSTYRKLFEVDVFGQIALTKLVLPLMIEQGSGHIAITSSVAGKIGAPFRTGYSAAKHAVMGFFDALRTEVSHLNIKVTTITPGYIRTHISANALTGDGSTFAIEDSDIRKGMSAQECADAILKGFAKGKPEIAVGRGLEMHALWLKRLFPKLVFKMAAKRYHAAAAQKQLK